MDDKRTEEMLRESWQPEPPDGMRERVLARARRGSVHGRLPQIHMPRWQAALVAASLLLVLFTSFSDLARQERLAAMNRRTPEQGIQVAACPQTLGWLHTEVGRLLERGGDE